MDKLVNSYIMSTMEEFDLNCIAARVLLNAMPGLESAAVFQDMVSKLNKKNKGGYDIMVNFILVLIIILTTSKHQLTLIF